MPKTNGTVAAFSSLNKYFRGINKHIKA